MFSFPMDKYRFYVSHNKVIAVSSYAGRRVRGVATCAPEDKFDIERGKQLAAARCGQKIAEKRLARAKAERVKAIEAQEKATKKVNKMFDYVYDARTALAEANTQVAEILESM